MKHFYSGLLLAGFLFSCGCMKVHSIPTQATAPLKMAAKNMVKAAQSGKYRSNPSLLKEHRLVIKSIHPSALGMDVGFEAENGKLTNSKWFYDKIEINSWSGAGVGTSYYLTSSKSSYILYQWDLAHIDDATIFATGLHQLQDATPEEIVAAYPSGGDGGADLGKAKKAGRGDSAAAESDSVADQLGNLNALWKSGGLTNQEYKKAKAKILEK